MLHSSGVGGGLSDARLLIRRMNSVAIATPGALDEEGGLGWSVGAIEESMEPRRECEEVDLIIENVLIRRGAASPASRGEDADDAR
jgi:hypothetical protein